MSEKWLTTDEFPKYEVSNLGRIRFKKTGRIRKLVPDAQGYLRINLKKKRYEEDKKVTTFCRLIHRLIAEAFIGPRPDGYQINHKDLDKNNNKASNLEYVTPKENQQHSKSLDANCRGSRHGMSKLTKEQVLEIRAKLDGSVDNITKKEIVREYGIHILTLRGIQKRESWKHI